MSFIFTKLHEVLRHGIINKTVPVRCFTRGTVFWNEEISEEVATTKSPDEQIDPKKDRRKPVPVETSIRYLASDAFKETYGKHLIWELYRRNHKGRYPPRKTRKTCIRGGIISTGNPCPICRDEYLILDYRNVDLLKQFISDYNGEILDYSKTGLCRRQHHTLCIAIRKAKDFGFIKFDVPTRIYNYSDWYKPEEKAL